MEEERAMERERIEKADLVGDSDLGDCGGVSDVSARRIAGDNCETDDSESGGVFGVGGEELGLAALGVSRYTGGHRLAGLNAARALR
jgi:hypothetical protein